MFSACWHYRNVPAHIAQTCHFFVYSKNGVMERCQRGKPEAYYSFSWLIWCLRSSTDSAVLGNRLGQGLWKQRRKSLGVSVGHWREGCVEGVAPGHTAGRQPRKGLAESTRESSCRRDLVWGRSVHMRLDLGDRTREVMWNLFLRQKWAAENNRDVKSNIYAWRRLWKGGWCDFSIFILSCSSFFVEVRVSPWVLLLLFWVDESSSKGK